MKKKISSMLCVCLAISLLAGCGNGDGKKDTSSESGVSEGTQSEQMSENQSSTDDQMATESQKPTESEIEEPTESQQPTESETEEPTESQKPTESETEEPTESQKPTESETEKPTESQKPSETETQEPEPEPTESESQEPEEPTESESHETETEEPEIQYEEYKLSTQTYDYARQISEKYYLVQKADSYGLVDFSGKEIVPIKYAEYSLVAEDEIEFYAWNYDEIYCAYVYSLDNGKLLLQYASVSETHWEDEHRETIVCNGVEHEILYGDPNSDPIGCFEADWPIEKCYQNGLVMEEYLVFDCADIYEYGAVPRNYVSFTDAKTGKLIYEGYTTCLGCDEYIFDENWEEVNIYIEGEPMVAQFSSDKSESKAVMLEYSIQEDKYYLVLVSLDGYVKHEIKDISIFDSGISYCNDWLKMPWTATMINTKTMKMSSMPVEKETVTYWYYGVDEYYATTTNGADNKNYTIYKGNKAIATGYSQLYFSEYYIIGKNAKGKYAFIDYTGKELLHVTDYGQLVNDRYLVNDGVGVYYVDETLTRVSDYIYEGVVDNCQSGAILIGEKYYLIAKK